MSLLLPIFFISLAGSIHCSVMCCPIQSLTASPLRFQAGRLLGYTLVWLVLRSISWTLIAQYGTPAFTAIAALLILWIATEALTLMGFKIFKPHLKWKLKIPQVGLFSLFSGMSLSLRGCGWMWSFVAFAAVEGDGVISYARLLAFFLGTLTPFLIGEYLPGSWALSPAGRGRWLLALAGFQIFMLFSNPFSGLHDLQTLLLGSEAKNLPSPVLCGPTF